MKFLEDVIHKLKNIDTLECSGIRVIGLWSYRNNDNILNLVNFVKKVKFKVDQKEHILDGKEFETIYCSGYRTLFFKDIYTEQIYKCYAPKLPRIDYKYFKEKNNIKSIKNTPFFSFGSKYICCINSWDELHVGEIECVVKYLEENTEELYNENRLYNKFSCKEYILYGITTHYKNINIIDIG